MFNKHFALKALNSALFLNNVVLILLAGFSLVGFAWSFSDIVTNHTEGLRGTSIDTLINVGCALVVTIPLQFFLIKKVSLSQNQENHQNQK